jgi:hypothetical protein
MPWFGPAGELLALAYLKQGNRIWPARCSARSPRTRMCPIAEGARAQMAGLLGFDAVDDIARAPAPAAGAPAAAPSPTATPLAGSRA